MTDMLDELYNLPPLEPEITALSAVDMTIHSRVRTETQCNFIVIFPSK